jgi:hypothetical protein
LEEGWVCTFHRDHTYNPPDGAPFHWDSAEEVAVPPPACILETSNVGRISPVFMRGIRMDIHEFTNGDLVALLGSLPPAAAAVLEVPPERTDDPISTDNGCDEYATPTRAFTGWFGREFRTLSGCGAPYVRLKSPVVGLRREDAKAICAARGGRLPTIDDYQRAARGLAPTARLFPWGDALPSTPGCGTGEPLLGAIAPRIVTQRNGVPWVPPVDAGSYDRTPGGGRNLLGNVSEWTGSETDSFGGSRFFRESTIYFNPPKPPLNQVGQFGIELTSAVPRPVGEKLGVRFSSGPAFTTGDRTVYRGFR